MPGRHGVQSLAEVCRASVPPGHIWHSVQPEELQKLPSAHGVHKVELACDE